MPDSDTLSPRRAQTRERIIRAAGEVFVEQGIQGSTVEQICERAGFTRGAFYSNFDSMIALCEGLLDQQLAAYASAFTRGSGAVSTHMGAHPEDRQRGPYAVVETALRILMPYLFDPQDTDRDAVASSVLFTELGLLAIREPSFRPAYRRYEQKWADSFGPLLEYVLGLCGLRLTVPRLAVVPLLGAAYERAVRDAMVGDQIDRMPELMTEHLVLMTRLITEPVSDGPV